MNHLHLDLNLDKHLDATLVIECAVCGHEITHHFRSLEPDSVLVQPVPAQRHRQRG